MTTRSGGVSQGVYSSFNLGDHVDDDPVAVAANRATLRRLLPDDPCWLKQVHGVVAIEAGRVSGVPEADAVLSRKPGTVCAVLTADCLPVLFCDREGTVVAVAHAGWRGLAGGVLEATVAAMGVSPNEVMAWMGAAIGPHAFEVGDEVHETFICQHSETAKAFVPLTLHTLQGAHASRLPNKWLADIYTLARIRMNAIGVQQVYGGGLCTYRDSARFFSYRRDGVTGRMASLIWLEQGRIRV